MDGPGAPARGAPAAGQRVLAHVGLGANLGNASATLTAAVHALAVLPGVKLRGVSRLYATAPVGVTDQPEFRNAAVALDVPAGPDPETGALALLIALKELERAFGRRERERWGPRELDLDLLLFGDARISVERPPAGLSLDPGKAARLLEVPHPAARLRLFVLAPLSDLAPALVPPGWDEPVAVVRVRRELEEGPAAVRVVATWDADAGAWLPTGGPSPSPALPPGEPEVAMPDEADIRALRSQLSELARSSREALRARRPQEAYLDADAAVALEPALIEGWLLRGQAAFELGLWKEAARSARAAAALAPDDPESFRLLILALGATGSTRERQAAEHRLAELLGALPPVRPRPKGVMEVLTGRRPAGVDARPAWDWSGDRPADAGTTVRLGED